MTGGTEFSEAAEITKDTPEIAEAQADLNKATFEAPSKIEEGDIQAAEKVQAAFVESVPLAQAPEVTPAASAAEGTVPPSATQISAAQKANEVQSETKLAAEQDTMTKPEGAPAKTDVGSEIETKPGMESSIPEDHPENPFSELAGEAGSSLDGKSHDPGDHYSGVDLAQGEVAQDSDMNEGSAPAMRADFSSDTDASTRDGTTVDLDDNQELNTGESAGEDPVPTEGEDLVSQLDQDQNTDTVDTDETGELDKSQIAIPASDGQIDFSGNIRKSSPVNHLLSALDVVTDETGEFRVPTKHPTEIESLPDRDPIGDYLETSADPSDLELNQQEGPPAYDPDLKLDEEEEGQQESSDRKASTREEILTLQDELSDWPDGEDREITVTTWEEGEDGTYVKVEKTVTLTKDEAQDLLDKMEEGLDEADSRGSSEGTESLYQLAEGSLLVGEAAVAAELAPDAVMILGSLESEIGQEGDGSALSPEELDEIKEKINNYLETISSINEQISVLEDLQQDLAGSQMTIGVVLLYAEKQSDGTYNMVPKAIPVSEYSIPQLIDNMRSTAEMIAWEIRNFGNEGDDSPQLEILHQFEKALQNLQVDRLNEIKDAHDKID